MKTAQKNEKNKRIWLLLLLVPVLVAIGVVAGTFISAQGSEEATDTAPEDVVEVTVPLEEFLINLGTANGSRSRYVKLELTLLSHQEEAQEVIEANLPKVRDTVIHVIHNKTPETLFAEENGSFVMKEELKNQINQSIGEDIVEEVYITNLLTQ